MCEIVVSWWKRKSWGMGGWYTCTGTGVRYLGSMCMVTVQIRCQYRYGYGIGTYLGIHLGQPT